MNSTLPKEYILLSPRWYDIVKTKKEITALIHAFTLRSLVLSDSPMLCIFNDTEAKEVFIDIFHYLVDRESINHNIYAKEYEETFIRNLIIALNESGYFG